MSKLFTNIVKSAGIMGLIGLMVTLVAIMAGAPSASAAARIAPSDSTADGKLTVFVSSVTSTGSGGIAGATVEVINLSGQSVAKGITNSAGMFANYVAEGQYKLRVNATGFQEFSIYTKIAAGQNTSVRALLKPIATPVPATTATPAPAPVSDAQSGKLLVNLTYSTPTANFIQAKVSVYDTSGNAVVGGYVDATGHFATKLAEGQYIVRVSASGFQDSKAEVTISSNQTTQVNLSLSPVSADPR